MQIYAFILDLNKKLRIISIFAASMILQYHF